MKIKNILYNTSLNTLSRILSAFPKYSYFGKVFSNALLLAVICISLNACKDPGLVGVDVQPDVDKFAVQYSNHFNIISWTKKQDSIRSDETNYNLLGTYIDPVFGKSEASFMCQFLLSTEAPDFTQTRTNTLGVSATYEPTIDSVVLSMVYQGSYGDVGKSNGLQRVKVYELTKGIAIADTSYSSKKAESYYASAVPIATYAFSPHPYTRVTVSGVKRVPQLRIKLDKDFFGKKIMGLLSSGGKDSLADNAKFLTYFKGLYITTDNSFQQNNQGAILYFNMLNADSRITAYYHNDTIVKHSSFDYDISSSSCARINLFKHDYSFAPTINAQLTDSTLGQSSIYVQAMSGLKSKIKLPFLDSLSVLGPIAINKAEIIFKVEPFDAKFVPNPQLVLYKDSLGLKYTPDVSQNSNFDGNYYGGVYDETNKQYRFNIARYVQLVIDRKIKDNGLYVSTFSDGISANRVQLQGGKNIQFNLTYTKL